jgi:hypothetical protein
MDLVVKHEFWSQPLADGTRRVRLYSASHRERLDLVRSGWDRVGRPNRRSTSAVGVCRDGQHMTTLSVVVNVRGESLVSFTLFSCQRCNEGLTGFCPQFHRRFLAGAHHNNVGMGVVITGARDADVTGARDAGVNEMAEWRDSIQRCWCKSARAARPRCKRGGKQPPGLPFTPCPSRG